MRILTRKEIVQTKNCAKIVNFALNEIYLLQLKSSFLTLILNRQKQNPEFLTVSTLLCPLSFILDNVLDLDDAIYKTAKKVGIIKSDDYFKLTPCDSDVFIKVVNDTVRIFTDDITCSYEIQKLEQLIKEMQ